MDRKAIKYPIYIVSKGRWENPLTAKMFIKEKIDFKIVIEPQEYNLYKKTIPEKNILCTDFSNLGLGSYPARNYIWEDSIKNGHGKHWVFDDNIRCFYRLNNGLKSQCTAIESFTTLEKLTDRYKNVAISGFNYEQFCPRKTTKKPFYYNVHVYSALLIKNDIPERWRLKYNEDVDLCLQVLDKKWCTILLNVFSAKKTSTVVKMKGGNQAELYEGNKKEKKVLKAKTLESIWPQYVKTVIRFNRPHHFVAWKKHFKHGLIRRKDINWDDIKK